MATTFKQCRGLFKALQSMRQQDPDIDAGEAPNHTAINTLLNITRRKYWMRLATAMPNRLSTVLTATYVASSESLAIGADSMASIYAFYKRPISGVEAKPATADAITRQPMINKVYSELYESLTYGDAESYAYDVNSGLIYLRPIPQVDWTLYVRGIPALANLSDSDNVTEFLDYPEIVAWGAVAAYKKSINDDDGMSADATAESLYDDVKAAYTMAVPDTHIIHVARRF